MGVRFTYASQTGGYVYVEFTLQKHKNKKSVSIIKVQSIGPIASLMISMS